MRGKDIVTSAHPTSSSKSEIMSNVCSTYFEVCCNMVIGDVDFLAYLLMVNSDSTFFFLSRLVTKLMFGKDMKDMEIQPVLFQVIEVWSSKCS